MVQCVPLEIVLDLLTHCTMSAYEHVASGSLKLKGSSGGITKYVPTPQAIQSFSVMLTILLFRKKKKSKKSKLDDAAKHAVADEKKKERFVAIEKTPAELKFEETQRRRVSDITML
jgi:hypothetical protein